MNKKAIIWDWNGTLLDDTDICVQCMNRLLDKRGLSLLDKKKYRDIFNVQVKEYYNNAGFDFEKEDFKYDTYPACKAIVVVRELWGDEKSFDYLHRIQKAFYVEGRDITKLDVLSELLEMTSEDIKHFREFYQTARAEILMQHDFSKARSMGANAFPSVVIIDEDGHMVCQKGYRSLLEMENLLKEEDA